MRTNTATAIGFSAVALWSLLAVLTVATVPVPPFLLTALTFGIGGAAGMVWVLASGGTAALARVPLSAYAFGTAGLFGYHFLYFTALRLAPAAEASLICYLWPLFIVLGSGLMPGESLRRGHVVGAGLAFAGAALIVAAGIEGVSGSLVGYGVAVVAALTWATYSLGSRRLAQVPTAAVAVTCLATAALSTVAHLALEAPAWPESAWGMAAILALGLGPVGLAFFTWDIGVKAGNIQLLGTASYAAPLLSTLALIAAGMAEASMTLALAAALIAGGAVLAARAGRGVTARRDG